MTERQSADTKVNPSETDPLSLLSHELRTPLNAIIGFAELLDRDVQSSVENQRHRDYARYILESGADLRDTIAGVLDVLSDHAGTRPQAVEPIDPASAVESCLAMLRPEAKHAGIRLAGRASGNPVRLLADPDAVAKVLALLVQDAMAGARRGDRITVSCGFVAGRRELVYAIKRAGPSRRHGSNRLLDRHGRCAMALPPRGADSGPAIWHWLVRLNGGRLDLERESGAPWMARVSFPDSMLRRFRTTLGRAARSERRRGGA